MLRIIEYPIQLATIGTMLALGYVARALRWARKKITRG